MTDPAGHAAEVEAWRAGRYANLRTPHGWLTLAGLGWLRPGVNRLGTAVDADVRLLSGPLVAGTVTVTEDGPIADGVFTRGGRPVSGLRLETDAAGAPTLLELGTLHLCVIERGGKLAIRSWDTEAKQLREFDGIDHWPVDPAWRLVAGYEPTPGATLAVADVIGIVEQKPTPATIAIEVEGETHRLQGLEGGPNGELWLVFGDATNGNETYGGGRFLYTAAPKADGTVVVDFNRAYNPPCVFSPYATCPLPWPANRLPIRVEAGERTYGGRS